eukprot:Pgem_evm1s343
MKEPEHGVVITKKKNLKRNFKNLQQKNPETHFENYYKGSDIIVWLVENQISSDERLAELF